jgi:hypothetical protein
MHTVTDEWLKAYGTDADSWNKKQLEALGITWPPRKGWKRAMIGTEITEQQKLRFEAARNRRTVEMF